MSKSELKEQIITIENEIANLQDHLLELKKSLLQSQNENTSDIIEKFNNWVDSEIADNHHDFIWECKASSGRNLFEYDGILYPEKYQTITLERIARVLNDMFYRLDSDGNYLGYKEKIRCTKQDILEWMQILMDNNFASMEYDW